MKTNSITTIVLAALLLGGCALKPEVAYQPDAGPYTVSAQTPVMLPYPELNKELQLRVAYPETPGRYPVIVFSHGGRCALDSYGDLTDHWVSHGYVVIQPAHIDSVSVPKIKLPRGTNFMQEAARTRRLDMMYIVDQLAEIERRVPGLAGKPDPERIVAAGHSLGGGTALAVTGLRLADRYGEEFGLFDERFDALLLITNPGNNPLLPEAPWKPVPIPTLVATGSKDYSNFGRRVRPGFGFTIVNEEESDAPHYVLDIDQMDHYLGGLICRSDVPGPLDPEAVRMINGTTVAFLDAVLKNDPAARRWLARPQIDNQRAVFERR